MGVLSSYSSVSAFATEIVISKCKIKSSTWPVQLERNEQTGNMEQKAFIVEITQEDPNIFVRETNQNGVDLLFPLKVSLTDKAYIENIIPLDGLKSGSVVVTPKKLLKKRIMSVGLISESVNGVLEVKGETVASKKFDARLLTVSRKGETAVAQLSCTNIKN